MHKFNQLRNITLDLFLEETSLEEQGCLTNCLDQAIFSQLKENRSVYLDNFGILYPSSKTKSFSSVINGRSISRDATILSPYFEKCIELTSFHRETFPEILELGQIAELIYPNLTEQMTDKWKVITIKRMLRPMIQQIKAEVVISGFCNRLNKTGTFIGLHNRQGSELKDWFAGADIFIKPGFNEVIKFDETKVSEKLSFKSAWEPFEAYYDPINTYTINVKEELAQLGFETEASHKNFNVQTFKDGKFLIFVTEGIRKLSLNPEFGTEFCVILEEKNSNLECVNSILTMGWILLSGHKQKILDFGKGLSLGIKLAEDSELEAIFTVPYKKIPGVRHAIDKNIEYVTLVGISASEYEIANIHGAEHLSAILRYRGIDQVTKIRNYSIVSETSLN